ncbi:MAG: hypothetical protein Q9174_005452 [Haloplaca sp. 1 TL-2023]
MTQNIEKASSTVHTIPVSDNKPSSSSISFMRLPPELRFRIYSFSFLDCQGAMILDDDNNNPEPLPWSTRALKSNGFKSLVRLNQTISAEVREMVYRERTVTMYVDSDRINILASTTPQGWWGSFSFRHFPSTPSFDFIRDWQIDLEFKLAETEDGRAENSPGRFFEYCWIMDIGRLRIADRVIEAVRHLARRTNLRSLTLRCPCLCVGPDKTQPLSHMPLKEIVPEFCAILEPIRCLHLQQPPILVTKSLLLVPQTETLTEPDQRMRDACWQRDPKTQEYTCPHPTCVRFLEDVGTMFRKNGEKSGSAHQHQFSAREDQWFDINRRAELAHGQWPAAHREWEQVASSLGRLWTLRECHYDTHYVNNNKSLGQKRKEFDECFAIVEGEMEAAIEEAKRLRDGWGWNSPIRRV